MTDDYSPVYQGDVGAPFAPQFLHLDKSPLNITGATLSMKMELVEPIAPIGGVSTGVAGAIKTCAGTFTIDDAANGKWHYQYQAGDLDTPGIWNMHPKATIGGNPITGDDGQGHAKQLVILPAP